MNRIKRSISMDFKLINWNVGGAKFFELPSVPDYKPPINEFGNTNDSLFHCREQFQFRLQNALKNLIETIYPKPHVLTLQEVVQFEENGDFENPKDIVSEEFFKKMGYKFHFFPLINTTKFSARAKWNKIQRVGNWSRKAYFAQGNAILVRDDLALFPVWSIPKLNITLDEFKKMQKGCDGIGIDDTCENDNSSAFETINSGNVGDIEYASEVVFVEQGLYFGDRNTEPRAAIVTHLVLDGKKTSRQDSLKSPLDLFIINLHLTTLSHEREGIPAIDEKAGQRRLKQLEIVFNDIISRYNSWKQQKDYKLRDEDYPVNKEYETKDRHKPVWIVTGDFNFTPQSTEFEYIIKRNFLNLCEGETKAKGLKEDPTLTVDYAFAGPLYYSIQPKDAKGRIRRNRVETDTIRVSDHYPLLINVPIIVEEV